MAPKTISFPPQPIDTSPIPVCLNYNNNDTLLIKFVDPGKFSDNNQSAFTDPIPTGEFGPNNVIGPYTPVETDNFVKLKYKDSADSQVYEYDVTIQGTTC